MTRLARLLPWPLLAVTLVDWLALREGWIQHPTGLLACSVGACAVALLLALAVTARRLWSKGRRRWRASCECLVLAGLLGCLGGGLTNWLFGLQGFVVVREGNRVRLAGGGDLQRFAAGPLARLEEMQVALTLLDVELVPGPGGTYRPRSRLLVQRAGGEEHLLLVGAGEDPASGPLRFHQGAFGFAPGIVLTQDDRTLLDRVIPFTSRRDGPAGVAFEQEFTADERRIVVKGVIDLDSLDAGLRGHATLRLSVIREGRLLGAGALLPGHFAELGEGHRVGFVDLKRWSEIDVSRRNYAPVMMAGAVVTLAGLAG